MLEIDHLIFRHRESDGFELNIPHWSCKEGERIAVVGRSGSGKTTFMKCLAGLLQPQNGKIIWKNERVKGAEERLVPGNDRIKLVRQDFGQDPHLKVVENLRKYILSHDDDERASRIAGWLEQLSIGDLKSRKTLQLSGGQLQRVALAQTLLAQPEVLLMDEPFSNLDPIHKHEFIPALRSLFEDESVTTISVLHDPTDALRIADRVVVISNGRIIEDGPAEKVIRNPDTIETLRLFGTVNILTPEEEARWFHPVSDRKEVEGHIWFRPDERALKDIRADYRVVRRLPMPVGWWSEVLIGDRLLLISE